MLPWRPTRKWESLGDTLANLLTLTDGIIVIGGGFTGALRHSICRR